jgi:AcrR family transcriptional regulator
MGIAERREREKEHLRTAILEAARDILSDEGLDALSMRAIAERIEYSPATIYLYFADKDELIREVVHQGFHRMGEYVRAEIEALGESANAAVRYAASGRAYARFALENTAYFRVMFELPSAAQVDCPAELDGEHGAESFEAVIRLVEQAAADGLLRSDDPRRTALIGWALVHGITSLFLSGHLAQAGLASGEEFLALVDDAMRQINEGWAGRGAAAPAVPAGETVAARGSL